MTANGEGTAASAKKTVAAAQGHTSRRRNREHAIRQKNNGQTPA